MIATNIRKADTIIGLGRNNLSSAFFSCIFRVNAITVLYFFCDSLFIYTHIANGPKVGGLFGFFKHNMAYSRE